MANSGQNFLNLLFGGINQGIDRFRQEQGQKTDLALTLQQMLQQQRNRSEDVAFRNTQFEAQQGAARAAAMRQGGMDLQNFKQQAIENARAGRALKLSEEESLVRRSKDAATAAAANALAHYRETQADNPWYGILEKIAPSFFEGFFVDFLGRPVPRTAEQVQEHIQQFKNIADQMLGSGKPGGSGAPFIGPPKPGEADRPLTEAEEAEKRALEAELFGGQ